MPDDTYAASSQMLDGTYSTGDDAILKEIRKFRDYAYTRWEKNRKEGDADMVALSVKGPWPEAELTARTSINNPRPHGHTDIISPYNNRVVNQARMNPRGVEVIPKGTGANEKTAQKREDRIRGIDYESHASQARLTGLQNAVDRGIGYWQVDTAFESSRSRNLKIVVKRIPNPNSILDDPDTEEFDRSDRKKLLKTQWITIEDAKRRWKALKDQKSFSADDMTAGAAWFRPDSMMFAEYWKVEETTEPLYFMNGSDQGVFQSELPDGAKVERIKGDGDDMMAQLVLADGQVIPIEAEREGTIRKVVKYFTNGFQIFEKEDWPGSTIPFPTVVGREKYEGDELVIESLTRKLREPNLNFDVSTAAEIEQFNMATKAKLLISDKAIKGYEEMYKMAHRNPLAYLLYHEFDEEGRPVTPPSPITFQSDTQGHELARNSFIRDAQNTAGMVSIERKQRENQSGVAQEKIDQASDIASFHFTDSYLAAIEFEGRIENELLTLIEDSKRTVGFRSKDGKYKTEAIEPMRMEDGTVKHPYGDADSHGVTIKTGPNYQSQMEKSREFLKDSASNPEFLANPLSPLIIEAMDVGPLGDKMQQVAIAVQPPQVQEIYAQEEGGEEPIPPRAQQAIQQAQQQLTALNEHAKQLETQVIELTDDLKAQKIQAESKERIAHDDNETKIQIAEINASVKEDINRLAQQVESMKAISDYLTAHFGIAVDSAHKTADRTQASELAATAAKNNGTESGT